MAIITQKMALFDDWTAEEAQRKKKSNQSKTGHNQYILPKIGEAIALKKDFSDDGQKIAKGINGCQPAKGWGDIFNGCKQAWKHHKKKHREPAEEKGLLLALTEKRNEKTQGKKREKISRCG